MDKTAALNILRIANDLLPTDPSNAHALVRNLRNYLEEGSKPMNRQAAVEEISSLIRVAYENPESRPALLPIIASKRNALKKKSSKKPAGKTSMKKATPKKATPKKATPKKVSSKKSTPKKATKKSVSRKRRASEEVQITSSDANW
jgi:hypothetical protein